MSPPSLEVNQETGWHDASRFNRGAASNLRSNARAVPNTLPRTALVSRGAANTAPTRIGYPDATATVAIDTLASAIAEQPNEIPQRALASEASLVSHRTLKGPIPLFAAYEMPPSFETSAIFRRVPEERTEILERTLGQDENRSDLMTSVNQIKILTGIIAAMLPIGGVLIGIIYSNLRGDIDDLKKSSIETVKTLASVDKQVGITNARLEDILKELQKPSRR